MTVIARLISYLMTCRSPKSNYYILDNFIPTGPYMRCARRGEWRAVKEIIFLACGSLFLYFLIYPRLFPKFRDPIFQVSRFILSIDGADMCSYQEIFTSSKIRIVSIFIGAIPSSIPSVLKPFWKVLGRCWSLFFAHTSSNLG